MNKDYMKRDFMKKDFTKRDFRETDFMKAASSKMELKHWLFAAGPGPDCLKNGREVTLPHTWSIEEGLEEYRGSGWYAHELDVPVSWAGKRVRLHFGAAFHSAVVYVNGREAGRHSRSGYTPFTVELTGLLEIGKKNRITVQVVNGFTEELLPFQRSFDWADDGGLIRGVNLLVTGAYFLDRTEVTARPVLTQPALPLHVSPLHVLQLHALSRHVSPRHMPPDAGAGETGRSEGCRLENGPAVWGVSVRLNGRKMTLEAMSVDTEAASPADTAAAGQEKQDAKGNLEQQPELAGLSLGWELFREGKTENPVLHGEGPCRVLCRESLTAAQNEGEEILLQLPGRILESVDYWHFDRPALYRLRLTLKRNGVIEDVNETVFGFRDFRVEGSAFYLNGERVCLCGTEWMPGSDPAYGAAETPEQMEKMLRLLKESNCVFTRFHWQQDDFILDWCDHHGMLVQEEVPFWGPDPEKPGELQREIALGQLEEMISAHRNHPCVIAWGVGNELCAQDAETIRYIRQAAACAHELDPDRCANYVSNTWFENPMADGTVDGDVLMINDYIGTWHGERDEHKELSRLIADNPGRPVVPSEFGLCEPAFSGGDARREQIFLEKMEAYRQHEEIAGTIYFCLNDYRTQMGEDGEGKLRRRVHGSVTMDGQTKPSYYTVQRECAPFILRWEQGQLVLTWRKDLPCYELRGYLVELRDDGGQRMGQAVIERLRPGESIRIPAQDAASAAVYRPTGDCAGVYSCK